MLYIRSKSIFGEESVRYLMSVLNFLSRNEIMMNEQLIFCLVLPTNFSFVTLLVIGQCYYGPFKEAQRRENIDLSMRKIFSIGLPFDTDPYQRCGEKSSRS